MGSVREKPSNRTLPGLVLLAGTTSNIQLLAIQFDVARHFYGLGHVLACQRAIGAMGGSSSTNPDAFISVTGASTTIPRRIVPRCRMG